MWRGRHATPRLSSRVTQGVPHDDRPPADPFTPTYARRSADSPLLAPHRRRVSARCGPVRQALPHLARSPRRRAHPHLSTPSPPPAGLRERLHPDGVCPPLFL